MKKTKKELEAEMALEARLKKESENNDTKYAIKLVERIVLGFLAAFGLGVIGVLVSVFAEWIKKH